MAGGVWTHLAVTASQSGLLTAIYINGVQVASRAQTSVSGLTLGNAQSSYGADRYFAGAMDDVRMYNHALTAAEIGQAMSGKGVTNIDPSERGDSRAGQPGSFMGPSFGDRAQFRD